MSETYWVDVALEEYRTLRQESLEAIASQRQVLQFGMASLAVVLGVGVQAGSGNVLSTVLLVGLLPVLAFLLVGVWFGAYRQMAKVGVHLAQLEKRVNQEFSPREVLTWEQSRAAVRGTRRLPGAEVLIFTLIGLGGGGLGLHGLAVDGEWLAFAVLAAFDLIIVAATFARAVKTKQALDEFSYRAREDLRASSEFQE